MRGRLPITQDGKASGFGIVARDTHRPVHQCAQLTAQVRKRLRQFGHVRSSMSACSSSASARRSRTGPDAKITCHGCTLEFDGARIASSSDSVTSSRGTGLSRRNKRMDRRSRIAFSRSYIASLRRQPVLHRRTPVTAECIPALSDRSVRSPSSPAIPGPRRPRHAIRRRWSTSDHDRRTRGIRCRIHPSRRGRTPPW